MINANTFDFPYFFPLWDSKPTTKNLVKIFARKLPFWPPEKIRKGSQKQDLPIKRTPMRYIFITISPICVGMSRRLGLKVKEISRKLDRILPNGRLTRHWCITAIMPLDFLHQELI